MQIQSDDRSQLKKMINQLKEIQVQEIQNKQFCLDFELKALSALLISGKQERWVHGFSSKYTEEDHSLRYELVKKYSLGKRILDIACGSGYGSYILANDGKAKSVLGVDIDENAIKYASIKNKHQVIEFSVMSAEDFNSEDTFDLVVSFETIEHLKKPEKFLSDMNNFLKEDGLMFLSTPISTKEIDCNPANPYHLQEWGFIEFQNFVSGFLDIVNVYIQKRPLKKRLSILFNIFQKPDKNDLVYLMKKIVTKVSFGVLDFKCKHYFKYDVPESSTLFMWNGESKKTNMFNKDRPTYQILICKKKNG